MRAERTEPCTASTQPRPPAVTLEGRGSASPSTRATRAAPTAVSLFSGAGGLDLGVEAAGYQVVAAVENDPVAVATLNANRAQYFPSLPTVAPRDITLLEPLEVMRELGLSPGELDLLVGGPPCVAFSKSGFHLAYKREGRDTRASLLDHYLRFLAAMKPRAFLLENVYGLAYLNQAGRWLDHLTLVARELGYVLTSGVLNAADYGVPQNRQRLVLVGTRGGPPAALPKLTHWGQHERRRPPDRAAALHPHVTASAALAGVSATPEPEEIVAGLYGHLLPEIPPGANYLHFTEHAGHPHPLFGWRSRYWTFLLKLAPERPASTIQAQPGPYVGPFHWDNRRLRVPELRRLQGFPDDYTLAGTRRDVQRQIGNSVPPKLGLVVAKVIRDRMEPDLAS